MKNEKIERRKTISNEFKEYFKNKQFEEIKLSKNINNIDLIQDIEVNISVRIGSTSIPLKDLNETKILDEYIIELDKLINTPVELYVENVLFALCEIIIIDGNYGITITELLSNKD
jgi:flagellar motor switch protein FliN